MIYIINYKTIEIYKKTPVAFCVEITLSFRIFVKVRTCLIEKLIISHSVILKLSIYILKIRGLPLVMLQETPVGVLYTVAIASGVMTKSVISSCISTQTYKCSIHLSTSVKVNSLLV